MIIINIKRKYSKIIFQISKIILILFCSINVHSQDIGGINKKNIFTAHGNLAANGLFYYVDGIPARSKPLSYLFSGNFNLNLAGVELPFSFVYSEQERNFRQPFNRFGVSPKYKWATLHIGYRNINYSPFTLGGYTVLGLGVDLNPGKFRFGFMYGRFMRPIEGNSSGSANSTPAFKRRGFATKIGYGNNKQFFDLIFLRITDDSSSIKKDSTIKNLTPAVNLVIGYNTHIEFWKKFVFESEAAYSAYTEDLCSKQAPSDDVITNATGAFIGVNGSTKKNSAVRASFQYKEKYYSIKLQYKRISPNYKSMGTYFMNNDLQQIAIEPAAMLLKSKLNLRASIGLQNDNLNNAKKTTTYRLVSSVNLSYNPFPIFGIDLSYSNYFTNQSAGTQALLDSTKYYQVNENIIVSPRFIITGKQLNHIISFSYNFMRLNDMNTYTEKNSEYSTHNVSGNYVITLLQYNASISACINYTSMKMATSTSNFIGGTVGLSKSFFKNKLSLNIPLSLQKTSTNGSSSLIMNVGSTINYKPFKKHSFNFNFNYIGNLEATTVSPKFNEIKGVLGYVFNF